MERVCLVVILLCLAIGAGTHIFDNIYFGFLPYRFAPSWLNIYWTSLGIIDLLAVYLLIKYRNTGLFLTLALMSSNVVINSIAYYSLGVIKDPVALQLQTLFLGFCLGSFTWLKKKY